MEPSFSADFEDLYIVTPLSTTDLSRVIYSRTQLSGDQKLYLVYQMLCGVHYISSAGVLHRDLKPANLLVDVATCGLKICDFGLSRCLSHEDQDYAEAPAVDGGKQAFTEYVVTRWYRAPEVMLGFHHYGAAIDVWAAACIFAELFRKNPLFPGNDYLHQLKIILKQIGTPTDDMMWFVTNRSARAFLDGLPRYAAQPLADAVPGAPPAHLKLVANMLAFDPKRRTPIADCVDDPVFDDYRENDLEARAGFQVEMDDIEAVALTKPAIQKLLYDDIRAFHRDLPTDRVRASSAGTADDPHGLDLDSLEIARDTLSPGSTPASDTSVPMST